MTQHLNRSFPFPRYQNIFVVSQVGVLTEDIPKAPLTSHKMTQKNTMSIEGMNLVPKIIHFRNF